MFADMQSRLIGALLALAVIVGGLLGIYLWGRAEGVKADAKRTAPIIAGLKSDMARCNANVDRLTISLEQQNAAVDALKADADERTRRANEAIKQAQRQAAGYRAKIDRIARAQGGPDRCEAARELIVSSLSEDRN